jgi:type IV pilus biogenesis protein CpaD/CtpE
MIAVNKIAIVALAALLAGCASTPQPNSEPAVRYFVSKQPAASVPAAAAPAEQKPS